MVCRIKSTPWTVFSVLTPYVLAQGCTPDGTKIIGQFTGSFGYVTNGQLADDSCWSHGSQAAFVTGATTCGSPADNAFEFFFGGSIAQAIAIPSGDSRKNCQFTYILDFDGPALLRLAWFQLPHGQSTSC
jgi:hypothetical protein